MDKRTSLRVVNETISLRERTTEVLRNAILDLTFKPGEKLVERKLCEETGVSRTSIRESLRVLEAEGLVSRESGKGLCVNKVTTEEIRDIYEVRRMLEGALLRKICETGTDAHIVALRKAVDRAAQFADPIKMKSAVDHANALNEVLRAITVGGENKVAQDFLLSLSVRMTYIRSFVSRSATPEERKVTTGLLQEVVEAVEARDGEAAADAYYRYIDRAMARAVELASRAVTEA